MISVLDDLPPAIRRSTLSEDSIGYARDLWPRGHLELRGAAALTQSPLGVVWPESADAVSELVSWASVRGIDLVPYGAGSGVCGAILPSKRTLVVDLKRLSRWQILEDGTLNAEAGCMGITLEQSLARKGFTVGHYPSSILCSTVGGWIAARGAGQHSSKYGKIEDMVASLNLVTGDGASTMLHRRLGGPDLTRLVVGSEGTLGIITSARLRLHPLPTERRFLSFSFGHIEDGWNAMRRILQAGLRPSVCRLYDPFDSFVARRRLGKSPSAPSNAGRLNHAAPLLRFAPLLNGIVDHVADKLFGGSLLCLIFDSANPGEAAADADAATLLCNTSGGRDLGPAPAEHWLEHRYGISFKQSGVYMAGAFSDTMEVAARWSALPRVYQEVRKALGKQAFVMAHLSHAYPDGCCVYFSFVGHRAKGEDDLYAQIWRGAIQAAIDAGGTFSHHHGVGRSKAQGLGLELGEGALLFSAARQGFDPHRIMNPSNLVPTEIRPVMLAPDEAVQFDRESELVTASAATTIGKLEGLIVARGLRPPWHQVSPTQTVGEWLAQGCHGAKSPWDDPVSQHVAGFSATTVGGLSFRVPAVPRRATGGDLLGCFWGAGHRVGHLHDVTLHTPSNVARRIPAMWQTPPPSAAETALANQVFAAAAKASR